MGERENDICTHVFDPHQWEEENGRPSCVESVKECPRETVPEKDKCIFHLEVDEKSDDDVREAFLEAVRNSSPAERELVGAKFGELILENELLAADDNQPIDLRHAKFSGPVSLLNTVIDQPVWFSCCTFANYVSMRYATFRAECAFVNAQFLADSVHFTDAIFHGDAFLKGTGFECNSVFFDRTTFNGIANFTGATLPEAVFENARFRRQVLFIGATFRVANFSNVRIDGQLRASFLEVDQIANFNAFETESADFRLATFSIAIFTDAVFRGRARFFASEFLRVNFSRAQFQADCDFGRARFYEVDFSAARLAADTKFDAAQFYRQAEFMDTDFERVYFISARFHQHAKFEYAGFRIASFQEVTFGGACTFKGATGHSVTFTAAVFAQSAEFKHAQLDWVYFRGVEFHGEANFRDATFGVADFSSGDVDDDLSIPLPVKYEVHPESVADLIANPGERVGVTTGVGATFNDAAIFGFAKFTDRAVFTDARFADFVRFFLTEFNRGLFNRTRFEAVAHFARATFHDVAIFDEAVFADGQFHQTVFDSTASFRGVETIGGEYPVDFFKSTITELTISQPVDDTGYYDFSWATIGDTTFDAETVSDDHRPFDFCRIYETSFEGLDFTAYHDVLAPEWTLHYFEGPTSPERDTARGIDSDRLEGTYLKAKNGAHVIGDDTATSQFFIHQMRHRRARHKKAAREAATRLRGIGHRLHTVGNRLLEVTSDYGESPVQVVGVAGGLILLFAVLFAGLFELLVIPAGGAPPTYHWMGAADTRTYGIEYVVFSLQSFVAFLLEGGVDTGNIVIQFLASLEAFLGAFFIALFVFTLTRSLNR